MPDSGFSWQRALHNAIQENDPISIEGKIGLARLAILERFVSPASLERNEEDALFEALDDLRALDWQQLLQQEERAQSTPGFRLHGRPHRESAIRVFP